jgi:4'-phosphopantetheinyl transferase
MIEVLYTRFPSMLGEAQWKRFLERLPPECHTEIERYRRWQDRYARLFSRLLLVEGVRRYGYGTEIFREISSTAYGRPFLHDPIDFNISHSGEYVVCAVTDRGRIGIDIEQIRPVALKDFERVLRPEEREGIARSDKPYDHFFTYWTMKESVIKAHGKGLSIPLQAVLIDHSRATLYDKIWFIHGLDIAPEYKCHLAIDNASSEVIIRAVLF